MFKKIFSSTISILLIPFSFLWEWVYRFRRIFYNFGIFNNVSFCVPVVSVGNLSFGGTGKTPFTIWLGNYLNSRKKKVMVLMRGYKGRLENSSGILRTGGKLGFNPFDYGDEALLFARKLSNASILVGKNRVRNLERYFDSEQPDVVLLDDGHQHLKLGRNMNIVMFDALSPISKYKVAPRGYLREGFSALSDADFIIIGRSDLVSRKKIEMLKSFIKSKLNKEIPFAEIAYAPKGIFNGNFSEAYSIQDLSGKKVYLISGVASPESFFTLIAEMGAEIVERYVYPDHYYFTAKEMENHYKAASDMGAIVLTTEKDIVKMRKVIEGEKVFYIDIQVEFKNGEKELINKLEESLAW